MKISILDDYHDTLRTLDCFKKLAGHEIKICNDHGQDVDVLAERVWYTEVLVLLRKRTEMRAPQQRARPRRRNQPSRGTLSCQAICTWHFGH